MRCDAMQIQNVKKKLFFFILLLYVWMSSHRTYACPPVQCETTRVSDALHYVKSTTDPMEVVLVHTLFLFFN